MSGGAIAVKNIKSFVDESYNKKAKDKIDDYELDKSISNDYAKVYFNPKTKHAVVVHRGTQGASDWLNNVAYVIGAYKLTNRYKTGKEIQEKAEKKYGKSNVSTVGHSQGAMIASEVGKNSKEIIKLNPAYKGEKEAKNEYTIRSKSDVVSGVKHFKPSKNTITIEADPKHRYNILNEHSSDILDRLDQEKMIGSGIQDGYIFKNIDGLIGGEISRYELDKFYKVYQIKDIIQQIIDSYPEKADTKFRSKNKQQLIDILEGWDIDPKLYVRKNNFESLFYKPPPEKVPADLRKKYGKKTYDEEEQKKFLEILKNEPRYKNPLLALKEYTDREGNSNYMKLQQHQINYIKQFVFSNLRGAIAFHGVGSGKTLTAVVSSYYYLKMYPTHKVLVISPSALIYNFLNEMVKYGLDVGDNRYTFVTYEKYARRPFEAKNTLVIIDEAHNLRTQIVSSVVKDIETNEIKEAIPIRNIKGARIMKYASETAHKIMLLTGTAFINGLYDIENLLAMVDNRSPIEPATFGQMLTSEENINDYFNYRISYTKINEDEKAIEDRDFPEMREKYIPLKMTEEEEKKYEEIKRSGIPDNDASKNPNAFFSAERYASNAINKLNNPKIKWIVDEILKNKEQKFIVYSALYGVGIQSIKDALEEADIKVRTITGRDSTNKKEESKKLYNGYNFGNPDFFDLSKINESEKKYINDKYRVLLISRAGAEGVDTINTQNIILMDSQWNDALSEQIIARAIRYKSHFGLKAKNEKGEFIDRYVNVYRLLYCNKASIKMAEKISEPNFKDWIRLNREINELQLKQKKARSVNNGGYLPTLKELKKLVIPYHEGFELFIPEESITGTSGTGKNKKSYTRLEGWDAYNKIPQKLHATDENVKKYTEAEILSDKRKDWRIDKMVEWNEKYNRGKMKVINNIIDSEKIKYGASDDPVEEMDNKWDKVWDWVNKNKENKDKYENLLTEEEYKDKGGFSEVTSFSIDLKMLIMSKSKGENIREFIERFGSKEGDIQLFESYQSELLPEIMKLEKKEGTLSDERQAEIYAKLLAEKNIKILKTNEIYADKIRQGKTTQKELQQYFTNTDLAKYLLTKTDIADREDSFTVLEPTAGHGALIIPIMKLEKSVRIDCIELDIPNREKLIEKFELKLVGSNYTNNTVNLLSSSNFLTFLGSQRYDYIFLNPPFHISKDNNALLEKAVYDIEFVRRAFAFLKVGGQMVAITGTGWINNEKRDAWTKDFETKTFKYETFGYGKKTDVKNDKFKHFNKFSGGVQVPIAVIWITKLSESDDENILKHQFYKDDSIKKGVEVIENVRPLDDAKKDPVLKLPTKAVEKAEIKAELKDFEERRKADMMRRRDDKKLQKSANKFSVKKIINMIKKDVKESEKEKKVKDKKNAPILNFIKKMETIKLKDPLLLPNLTNALTEKLISEVEKTEIKKALEMPNIPDLELIELLNEASNMKLKGKIEMPKMPEMPEPKMTVEEENKEIYRKEKEERKKEEEEENRESDMREKKRKERYETGNVTINDIKGTQEFIDRADDLMREEQHLDEDPIFYDGENEKIYNKGVKKIWKKWDKYEADVKKEMEKVNKKIKDKIKKEAEKKEKDLSKSKKFQEMSNAVKEEMKTNKMMQQMEKELQEAIAKAPEAKPKKEERIIILDDIENLQDEYKNASRNEKAKLTKQINEKKKKLKEIDDKYDEYYNKISKIKNDFKELLRNEFSEPKYNIKQLKELLKTTVDNVQSIINKMKKEDINTDMESLRLEEDYKNFIKLIENLEKRREPKESKKEAKFTKYEEKIENQEEKLKPIRALSKGLEDLDKVKDEDVDMVVKEVNRLINEYDSQPKNRLNKREIEDSVRSLRDSLDMHLRNRSYKKPKPEPQPQQKKYNPVEDMRNRKINENMDGAEKELKNMYGSVYNPKAFELHDKMYQGYVDKIKELYPESIYPSRKLHVESKLVELDDKYKEYKEYEAKQSKAKPEPEPVKEEPALVKMIKLLDEANKKVDSMESQTISDRKITAKEIEKIILQADKLKDVITQRIFNNRVKDIQARVKRL